MNKKKEYVRTYPCGVCNTSITAKYNSHIGRWVLTCLCGEDMHYKRLNKEVWLIK